MVEGQRGEGEEGRSIAREIIESNEWAHDGRGIKAPAQRARRALFAIWEANKRRTSRVRLISSYGRRLPRPML